MSVEEMSKAWQGVSLTSAVGGQVGAVGGELEEGGHEVEERVHGNIARNLVKYGENNQIQDSVPLNLEVVRCSLAGTVVRSATRAYNSCSSSTELDAQYVQPHQKTIKRKKTTPEKHVPAFVVVTVCQKLKLQ